MWGLVAHCILRGFLMGGDTIRSRDFTLCVYDGPQAGGYGGLVWVCMTVLFAVIKLAALIEKKKTRAVATALA